MRKHIGLISIGLIIIAILLIYMTTFTLRWQEKGFVLTFGKISRQMDKPGLHLVWPWQSVVKFDGRIRTLEQQASEIQTKDKQTVLVVAYINWRISDPRVFYERFRTEGAGSGEDVIINAEKNIRAWISEATNVFAEYNLGELVTADQSKFKLVALEKGGNGQVGGMLERIQDKSLAEGGYGIDIIDVGIKRLGIPDSVSESVFARMREERQAVVKTLVSEGMSQAASLVGEAESKATIIKAQAQAKAKEIEGKGDAEAAQYYAKFLDHPELANFLRKLETLRKTLSKRTTMVLDKDTPPYKMMITGPEILQNENKNQAAGSPQNK